MRSARSISGTRSWFAATGTAARIPGGESTRTCSPNNLVYEAHQYFDRDFSGQYVQSYDDSDAHPNIGVERLQPFAVKRNNESFDPARRLVKISFESGRVTGGNSLYLAEFKLLAQ
jgi:hypothetical protein